MDSQTGDTSRVCDTERLARFALELRRTACDASGHIALSRVLPCRTQQAAIWRVAGVVTVVLTRHALHFDRAERLAREKLVLSVRARGARSRVRHTRELANHARLADAVRGAGGAGVDIQACCASRVRDAERLALLALELRLPTRDAAWGIALSRILPWRTQQAAIWCVDGAVTVELTRSALNLD